MVEMSTRRPCSGVLYDVFVCRLFCWKPCSSSSVALWPLCVENKLVRTTIRTNEILWLPLSAGKIGGTNLTFGHWYIFCMYVFIYFLHPESHVILRYCWPIKMNRLYLEPPAKTPVRNCTKGIKTLLWGRHNTSLCDLTRGITCSAKTGVSWNEIKHGECSSCG